MDARGRGGRPPLERVHDSLFAITDGRIGTSDDTVLAAGLYEGDGPETTLLPVPSGTGWPVPERARRGRLRGSTCTPAYSRTRCSTTQGRSFDAFSSLARPGSVALRAEGAAAVLPDRHSHRPGPAPPSSAPNPVVWIRDTTSQARRRRRRCARRVRLPGDSSDSPRIAATRPVPDEQPALRAVAEAEAAGFERLLSEHRAAWASRWEGADVVIESDPELQLAVRLALFHLMASVGVSGEAAVGARGLTGPAYRGHVFWDSDVFVLPFLAATASPPHGPCSSTASGGSSRPRRRAEARPRGRALRLGVRGTASTSPADSRETKRAVVAIRTGELEEHIVADVAWAAELLRGLER